ncbi:hypothetical protein CERSUDRAFT_110103 [Gelatoporia subvermispora B]|uniref:Uncharacterized protein n=1 Tax=Ceriporiopsis subvermispora (strain B) TaxID=914234 RepID=M2RRN6_CERS8|nr:hypothetical protein CERSUDRAFT_110103 [Gelatoporia subvermispora B]
MSAAASDLAVEQVHEKAQAGSALKELGIPADKPLICVDLDDVLSQTNRVVAEWHNDTYGSDMKLSEFYYYYYWKNPHWGTPEETFRKVEEFYKTDRLDKAPPIPGAFEGAQALKKLGFALVVVTARQRREMERSMKWLEEHYPNTFETMICTGQSQETLAEEGEVLTKLSKAEVCAKLGAKLMIDDSVENALKCAKATPPVAVLLLGDYAWNQREAKFSSMKDETSFAEKLEKEGGREFWKDDDVVIPEGQSPIRVKNWEEIVRWVEQNIKI